MYDAKELNPVYHRLKEQYPCCEIVLSGDSLTLKRLHGRVEINREEVRLYVNGTLCDQISSEKVETRDDLYELVEAFLIQLQQLGMEGGNKTYIASKAKAAQQGTRFLVLASLILTGCLFAVYLTHSLWWMLAVFVCPGAALVLLGVIHKQIFRIHWVCPQCGQALPLKKRERFPQMKYVSQCPHCGCVLEDSPHIEPIQMEREEENKQLDPADHLPCPGKKWPCVLAGVITVVLGLFLLPLLFVSEEPLDPVGTAVAAVLLLLLLGLGLALMVCRHTEPEEWRQPVVVLREMKAAAVWGVLLWLVGIFFTLIAMIYAAVTTPFDAGFTLFVALSGVFLTLLGVWMLLAYRNRALFVFCDHSIVYISSWGRVRKFAPGQVASVQMTDKHFLRLLDKSGKKLVSLKSNMQGACRFAEWMESADLSAAMPLIEKQQPMHQSEQEPVVQWREEDRTPLHDHLKAIRFGFVLVTLLLAAGSVVPLLLYLFTDLKMVHTVYLTVFSPLPFVLYYAAFAPVFSLKDRDAGATDEWNAMHIKFPVMRFVLFVLLIFAQSYYIWEKRVLSIVDFGRFFLFMAIVTAILIVLCWVRTSRYMRRQEGFVMVVLSLLMTGFVVTYGINLAISKPVEHYPAVVVDRNEKDQDEERSLTVLLDDGTERELYVSKELYEWEQAGGEIVVCQKENFLGIRLARLHLPKGVDQAAHEQIDEAP